MRSGIAIGLGILGLLGCGGGGGGTDAGGGGGDSGGTTFPATGMVCRDGACDTLPMPPTSGTGTTPAMLDMVGMATAPMGATGMISVDMTLVSFGQDGDTAANTRVCFCPDNVLAPEVLAGTGCGACQDQTSGMDGHLTVMAHQDGWYAYRVFAHSGPTSRTTFLDSIQINEQASATVDGNAVSALTANTISAAELISRTPGTTTIAGRVFDGGDDAVRGAAMRAFHADGTEIPEGVDVGAPHYRYFDGTEHPDAGALFTGGDGLYIVGNVTGATAGELIRIEAWATIDSSTPVRIGCEAVSVLANGVSIANIGPLRSDYPAGHPCGAGS